eukprot:957734-Rhodomonas_salina.1
MAASLPPAPLPTPHTHASFSGYSVDNFPGVVRGSGGVMLGGYNAGKESKCWEEPEKKSEREKMWGITQAAGREGSKGAAQAKRGEKKGEPAAKTADSAVHHEKSASSDSREEGESKAMQNKDEAAESDQE